MQPNDWITGLIIFGLAGFGIGTIVGCELCEALNKTPKP